jgi:hypothetical protein
MHIFVKNDAIEIADRLIHLADSQQIDSVYVLSRVNENQL